MTPLKNQLWDKILGFEFDEPGTVLTFAARLARENGWNNSYTQRVIDEYKKFIFLCCTSTTQVTPSDPVDQAWHLHLTYTRSYWNTLCRDTLGREIHHNPTKGGKAEQQKFDGLYTSLKEIYKEQFGIMPPQDIWHDNTTRFTGTDFRRVNLSRYWMVKKPEITIRSTVQVLMLAGTGLLSIQATGNAFIVMFIIIMVIAIIQNSRNGGKGGNNDSTGGCSAFSCSSDSGHSGCSSHGGDSGCSGCSGCGGCGGGCGGD